MNLNVNGLIILVIVLLYISFYLMMRTIINKYSSLDDKYVRNNKRLALVLSLVNHTFKGSLDNLREVKNLKENLILDQMDERFRSEDLMRVEKHEIKKLYARNRTRRKEACAYLGLIGSEIARLALEEALGNERDYSVRIYISNALTDIRHNESLDFMILALLDTHKWYREKAISNILEYGNAIHPHFMKLKESHDVEIVELLIKYSSENFNDDTKAFLFHFANDFDSIKHRMTLYYKIKNQKKETSYKVQYLDADMNALLSKVCRVLSDFYYTDFDKIEYYTHDNYIIQKNAFWALSKRNSTEHFKILLGFLNDKTHEKTIVSVVTRMIETNPRFLYVLETLFEEESNEEMSSRIAQVLSNKIEYYILKLNTKNDYRSEKILKEILKNQKINEMVGFLNVNKDLDIENRLVGILKEHLISDSTMEKEFRTYLDPRIIEKLDLTLYQEKSEGRTHKRDPELVRVVLIFTFVSILFLPVVYIATHFQMVQDQVWRTLLKGYVIGFNYWLAYYSIAINLIYMSLLFLSYKNVKKQSKLWNVKNISMMFRNKMIPSISIIAPAYNEEKTIIASAKSLLNLNYPDYELIIVNDGSKDDTLYKLITAFNLVRVDYYYKKSLSTAPIRGIYRNPSLPKMVVVDKSNGGKADSLNAGINVANKTYFCGIDADSLLEPEALLKIASLTLDESVETPALGGNIFPINGCRVDKGLVTDIGIPKNHLARFQTIEYIRAFMAGRLGWQQINSLLIISGAFGLFRKDRIIGIGGYLTEKGKYKKDTVGEDMELVVRITRLMHELKRPFKVLYAFNANCWTEVPEDLKSLKSQRFRWHRGLIDILYFHRKMLFNKSYGRTGMLAMPYFVIFEAIGPMFEIQGYLMVVLAAMLGILDANIAMLLFISTIFMGIIVSLSALLIAEKETHYFNLRDLLRLIGYAVIENFGPRQLFSFWRLRGQINIVFGQGGWGQIKRKGVSE